MHWTDTAFVLGARAHGESSVILEVLTRDHGRHLGLVHGGRSKAMRPVLQPGNGVHLVWRARLDEHLGSFQVEPAAERAGGLIGSSLALYGLGAMAAHLRLLPERDPHPALYETALLLLDHLADEDLAGVLFARFELTLLAELGFGLDLASCAATGGTADLVYVSPRTGRAVGAAAGEPYREKLLPLPAFLSGASLAEAPAPGDLGAAFGLTAHFLRLHAYGPRGLEWPPERERFAARCTAA